tara:strand:- start:249 stop:1079 length:831 start_codon:yes stop_codon:yes gene_type:complete
MVMSKKTDKDIKKSQVEEVNPEAVEDDEADSPWYYFYSQGCGWCKKTEPIVDELIKEGHDILKLDVSDPDNQALNRELQQEYNIQCGTPWFINEATGKGICGFREKDVIEKWLAGEDIPVPPRPKGPIPKTPLLEAPEKEVNEWKVKYEQWLKENDHMPKNQLKSADELLALPRPKTEPPRPPQPNFNDEQFDKWGEEYDKWKDENGHLPNLQPSSVIVQRLKQQRDSMGSQGPQVPSQDKAGSPMMQQAAFNTLDAKLQALEVKVDKIIEHFGIK